MTTPAITGRDAQQVAAVLKLGWPWIERVAAVVDKFPALAFALILATALNGMAVMRCFFALFSGTRSHVGERDLTPREIAALTLVLALLFIGGLVPGRLLTAPGQAPSVSIVDPHGGGSGSSNSAPLAIGAPTLTGETK